MEKGIASLEIKMSEKGMNQAFRTGVKKEGRWFSFYFFRFIFGGKSWRALRGTAWEKDLAVSDAGALTNTDQFEFTDIKRTERAIAVLLKKTKTKQ